MDAEALPHCLKGAAVLWHPLVLENSWISDLTGCEKVEAPHLQGKVIRVEPSMAMVRLFWEAPPGQQRLHGDGFHKWGYPQITNFNRIFPYKPSILGTPIYPHICRFDCESA